MAHEDGEVMGHDAVASMNIALQPDKGGVSMSRLCSILQQEAEGSLVDQDFFSRVLNRYQEQLADKTDSSPITRTYLKLSLSYPVKQKSLRSENWGWQYYPLSLIGEWSRDEGFKFFMELEYLYSSTCPCSLSMAKQYEVEYREGKTLEGAGIGVPHSQRSRLVCKAQIDQSKFTIEDLVQLIRIAIPTETQSLVKRVDEQAFAILNGSYPMFVEHATRRLSQALNSSEHLLDWICSVEHLESLHGHNAAAVIYKDVAGGLRSDNLF